MPDAVIVSTARTPIGKAFRGAFNITHGAVLGGHVVKHAVARAGIAPDEVEDVVMGCAMPERATGQNIARLSALRAGLPVSVSGVTVNRFCSSGLQTIAFAAQRIMTGEAEVIVAGGLESISLLQEGGRPPPVQEEWLLAHKPEVWMPMIETADIVAGRYNVSRESQDEYSLESQRRTAAGQQAGRFADEIVPLPTTKKVVDKVHRCDRAWPCGGSAFCRRCEALCYDALASPPGRLGRHRCRAAARHPRRPLSRSPPPRRLRGSAGRT